MLRNTLIRVPSVGMALAFWGVLVAGQQACVAQSGEASFRQLEDQLPTPNAYRAASGAPGAQYWQQRADYDVSVELDDENQRIVGSERITYYNHSPDSLRYLWLQLDANLFSADSDGLNVGTAPSLDGLSFKAIRGILHREGFDSALVIKRVEAANGTELPHTIVKTMMRIDLPNPLSPGASYEFEIDWSYSLIDAKLVRARSGFEFFPEDGNFIYEVAQWFPRMASYTDDRGWHHKQFIGSGEFTVEFGDYLVRITVPDDHVVASTGTLQNPSEVLSDEQRARLDAAESASSPVFIVNPEEAKENQSTASNGKRTWVFKADNVRDFAFASSRKFIWDAQGYDINGNKGMAMSYYPNEAEPLWSLYSTEATIHTVEVYSRFTFDYPYPVAISVNGPVGGMEYPMICFNGPRPKEDGTYWGVAPDRDQWWHSKYGLISVIIHEVGHNFFPMIVNSDERQWTWMDEGLNTFLQFLTEQEWEEDYPSKRGEPRDMVGYMTSKAQVPIMSNSESILQFGNNAYGKPATALNVLRETVLGRELFDFAFKEYSQRWMFKRPQPADLFRTMEDASGIDLDWFWRGWFYSTDHVDLAIEDFRRFQLDTMDPVIEKARAKRERAAEPRSISEIRNEGLSRRLESHPQLADFYNEFDELDVTDKDRETYEKLLADLEAPDRDVLKTDVFFYVLKLKNVGGVVMPVIVKILYEDGSHEVRNYPAELWRQNSQSVSKLLVLDRAVAQIQLDPFVQTGDADRDNNYFPRRIEQERFHLEKEKKPTNPMQEAKDADPSDENED